MRIFAKSFFSVLTGGLSVEKTLVLPDKSTAMEAIMQMGISPDNDMIILVNQRPSNEKVLLADGDKLTIMPPVSAA